MVKDVKYGTTVRKSYSKIGEFLEMPNLIEVQKNSYQWFLDEGLREVFRDVSAITDYTGTIELSFIDYTMNDKPKYTVKECKERDATYAAPIKVKVRLRNRNTEEIKEQELYVGDLPVMTDTGTFVINGAERVIISQLVRSPGIYFTAKPDKTDKYIYTSTIIPNRGAWLEYETDANNLFYVRIDKNRKLLVTSLIRTLGVKTDAQIRELYGEDERMLATLEKDTAKTEGEALVEIYRRLRPGEPPTVESSRSLLDSLFFDPKRYDISRVGRFKYNKKLALGARIAGRTLALPVVDPMTGELIAEPGETLTRERADFLESRGVARVLLNVEGHDVVVFTNNMVDLKGFVSFDPKSVGVNEKVHFPVLEAILRDAAGNEETLKEMIRDRIDELIPKNIIADDILASINYLNCLAYDIGNPDDTDHLGNKRLRSVGELLQNQFRIGFSRMERVIKERMSIQDLDVVTPQSLINVRPITAAIKEFFGSSPLSQFMDQTNPLAELTHKRRLSALGPGGLTRDRANFEVRDVHYSHYGRMCPIETPEGPNIGLISYLASYAKINDLGFIEAPYCIVDKETGVVSSECRYMTADQEEGFYIAQANEPMDENRRLLNDRITCRYRDEIVVVEKNRVDLVDVSPKMMISIATAMIPFVENDDANRALMGSNMQRQAVPLLRPEAPIVGTGMEHKAAVDSGVCVCAEGDGIVVESTADHVKILYNDPEMGTRTYELIKFLRSNQGTCINQRPIVSVGERVEEGQVIADGPSSDHGEISLGRNVLIGYMNWEGYNYEDAVLLNERLVRDDVFTSIHIEEYETESRDTKLGPEDITRDIPNVGEDALKDLDEEGIIRIGAEVRSGDILVGKVTPKGETELTAEERLLRAIFGDKAREVRDTSLRVPHGEFGIIVDVKIFTRENRDELSPGVNQMVRVYIAQKRKIQVGDKMAGRHGNKGVVSRVLPEEDMPFLADGTPLDICLNPLGVPSRMNIGQVLEVHLGLAAKALGWHVATPVFDGARQEDIDEMLDQASHVEDGPLYDNLGRPTIQFSKIGINRTGKLWVYDGRTGDRFDNPVTVGYMYYLKLHHLVDDKIHARSTGPYSLVTQQPLGGKAQFGGQRFGEMEVWALEAYGASHVLQEILTVKSDDTIGRVKTYEAIVKGENIPDPGVPESFKVLIKELQSLALDIKVLSEDKQEIEIRELEDDIYATESEFKDELGPVIPPEAMTEEEEAVVEDFDFDDLDLGGDDDLLDDDF